MVPNDRGDNVIVEVNDKVILSNDLVVVFYDRGDYNKMIEETILRGWSMIKEAMSYLWSIIEETML